MDNFNSLNNLSNDFLENDKETKELVSFKIDFPTIFVY